MKKNTGRINQEGNYEKFVQFSKAVLWKDRQLSIPFDILRAIMANKCRYMIFIDRTKEESWIFKTTDVIDNGEKKQVGQEPQWYFPIELATKDTYETKKPR